MASLGQDNSLITVAEAGQSIAGSWLCRCMSLHCWDGHSMTQVEQGMIQTGQDMICTLYGRLTYWPLQIRTWLKFKNCYGWSSCQPVRLWRLQDSPMQAVEFWSWLWRQLSMDPFSRNMAGISSVWCRECSCWPIILNALVICAVVLSLEHSSPRMPWHSVKLAFCQPHLLA